MITIIQADRNYKNNSNYYLLSKNIERMDRNKNNYNIHIDDNDFNKDDGGAYTRLKIIKLLEILRQYDDNEIIMYIDAFDTIVVADDSEIENKFLDFGVDVLYSCERCCWPSENFRKYFSDNYFVNSGTIIFKNKKYQEILEVLSIIHQRSNICDQYYHTLFVTINSLNVKTKLDKLNNIFQCLWGYDVNEFEEVNDRKKNKATNTFPCVFHGNGSGKSILKKLFDYEQIITFLGFVEDKMGINFMNSSNYDNIAVYAEIKNTHNQIIYSNTMELPHNISFYIQTGIKDNYIFTIYDLNNEILLQEKNY
jgi:hypothetical protein